jgi:hypothetical protein
VHILPIDEGDDANVTFLVRWTNPPDARQPKPVERSSVVGGQVIGRDDHQLFDAGFQFAPNSAHEVVVARSGRLPIHVAITLDGGYTDTAYSVVSATEAVPLWKRLLEGERATVQLHRLTKDIGSIQAGSTYTIFFSRANCTWTSAGPHITAPGGLVDYRQVEYGFGPGSPMNLSRCISPENHEFDIFGHGFTFDDSGIVYDSRNPAGRMAILSAKET